MATLQQKLSISIGSAVLFAIIGLPQTYKFTNSILPLNLFDAGCPTNVGLIVHTLVFFALTYASMTGAKASKGTKIKHSLYGTLIFFLISSPAMYALVAKFLGSGIASAAGCPTVTGVLLHAAVYCAALVAVMYLP